ncbi:MAG: protein translocase subunit SecD [Candidatus Pacebacteria bacterium]|nr:protein translocase subunit SecD [Candidatus Paceibacterota bacterium]
MFKQIRIFIAIIILTIVAGFIAIPDSVPIKFSYKDTNIEREFIKPEINFNFFGKQINPKWQLKKGLDIQGGMQVVLQADMSEIDELDRVLAIESAQEIILRRVDLFGINEPVVQTSINGDEYRIIVELAGVSDSAQALELVGQTAQLDFRLQNQEKANDPEATQSALFFFGSFEETGLTGKQLKRSSVQFDPQTNEPVISLEFDSEGTKLFADITKEHEGEVLAIFLDGFPVTTPVIQTPILNGIAQLSGGFDVESAKQLNIQLSAGALPVPIRVLEQRTIGASLGQESVEDSVRAGVVGILLVMLFMTLYYGVRGILASFALLVYTALTFAVYKVMGVTVTLPGVAGLLLSVGMAVDANILIFERMKEELRAGKQFEHALELGFGRSWDSIKDANLATIMTSLVLINPLNLNFLNTSGLVRGFGITLLIGVLISLFTGVVVTRNFLRLFLKK